MLNFLLDLNQRQQKIFKYNGKKYQKTNVGVKCTPMHSHGLWKINKTLFRIWNGILKKLWQALKMTSYPWMHGFKHSKIRGCQWVITWPCNFAMISDCLKRSLGHGSMFKACNTLLKKVISLHKKGLVDSIMSTNNYTLRNGQFCRLEKQKHMWVQNKTRKNKHRVVW